MGLINETVQVVSNQQVGPRLHLMVLDAPAIAAGIQPCAVRFRCTHAMSKLAPSTFCTRWSVSAPTT